MGLPISPPEPRAEYVAAEERLQRYIDRYAKRRKDFEALTAYGENETQPEFTYLALSNAGLNGLCNQRIRTLDALLGAIHSLDDVDDAMLAGEALRVIEETEEALHLLSCHEAALLYFEKHALVEADPPKAIKDLSIILKAMGAHAESIAEEYDRMPDVKRFPG